MSGLKRPTMINFVILKAGFKAKKLTIGHSDIYTLGYIYNDNGDGNLVKLMLVTND